MNRFILWTSICVVLLASCSDYSELDNPIGDAVGYNGVELTVKASYGKEATRTVVASNGTTIMWSPGDAINMFYGSGSAGKFTEQSLSGPATYAEFNGVLNVVTGSNETGTGARSFWGVYPYNEANTCDGSSVTMTIPSIQLPAENTFANGLNPSVATGLGLDLVFYNVGSWFIFTVESEGITSATLTGNNGEDLVGKVKVTMDSEGHPSAVIIDGEKSVTMNAPEGGFTPGVQYYMVILPQTLQQGYTLTLSKGDQTASFVNTNSSEFIRSWYRRKQKADSGLEFESSSDYVDLGLSVKWAKVNLGASSPEEFGDYYAWGETTPQSSGAYSWASYRWSAAGNSFSFTKYCSDYNYGNYYTVRDRNYVLDPQDDVASVKLGGNWRMPTDQEMDELLTNCTWTWDSSRSGYIVSSKVNNNSIFLPSAGRKYSNKIESGVGYYWTSSHESVYSNQQYYAQGLYFTSSSHTFSSSLKCNGLSVRPVYSDNDIPVSYVANYELNQIELTPGHYYILRAYIYPEVATNQEVTWASSDESIATVSSDGKVTAVAEGNATITITSVDGGKTAYCQVLVTPDAVPDYVDLGLSVKWGTKNVGASLPEDYGNHFSWGEITTKTDYSWSTYRFGSQSSLTKYSKTDGLVTLEPEDDAAYVNIGEDWRIPSSSEWKELTDNCTWTWEARNGTRGLRIVSKINGNSIFLPASGYQFNNRHLYSGRECFYWMSEVNASNQSEALCRILSASVYSNVADGVSERKNGMSIRPIYDERPESVHVESITINQPTLSLELGSVGQLTTTILPTDVSNTNVTWTSSDLSVATVDAQGVVTAVSAGTATITVTTSDGSKTATCAVTVTNPVVHVESVSLNKTSLSLTVGGTETIQATVSPSTASNTNVTWSSSNTSVATVSNGTVTAQAVGTATITASAGGKSATCTVTVSIPVTGVSLDKTITSVHTGNRLSLNATLIPSNATNKNVTWASSNTSVATVNANGFVTPVAAGSTTITVKTEDGSKTKSCVVTVIEQSLAAVDMGVSVYWANMNLGASSEVCVGTRYDNGWKNDSDEDCATLVNGSKWRTPTKAEWEELVANCTIEWIEWDEATQLSGGYVSSQGCKLTSKTTGNSISFITPYTSDCDGNYWTSTKLSSTYWYSHISWGDEEIKYMNMNHNYLMIRPVKVK